MEYVKRSYNRDKDKQFNVEEYKKRYNKDYYEKHKERLKKDNAEYKRKRRAKEKLQNKYDNINFDDVDFTGVDFDSIELNREEIEIILDFKIFLNDEQIQLLEKRK